MVKNGGICKIDEGYAHCEMAVSNKGQRYYLYFINDLRVNPTLYVDALKPYTIKQQASLFRPLSSTRQLSKQMSQDQVSHTAIPFTVNLT